MIELSVNLNKIALLRNSRGGDQPSVLEAADTAIGAGAYGITVHPRPDQRHVRPHDVADLGDRAADAIIAASSSTSKAIRSPARATTAIRVSTR